MKFSIKGKTERAKEEIVKYALKPFTLKERVWFRMTKVKWEKSIIEEELILILNMNPSIMSAKIEEGYREGVVKNIFPKIPEEEFKVKVTK